MLSRRFKIMGYARLTCSLKVPAVDVKLLFVLFRVPV
jgi:hypothetical protein